MYKLTIDIKAYKQASAAVSELTSNLTSSTPPATSRLIRLSYIRFFRQLFNVGIVCASVFEVPNRTEEETNVIDNRQAEIIFNFIGT